MSSQSQTAPAQQQVPPAEADGSASGYRKKLAKRREVAEHNVSKKGTRLLLHLTVAMLVSAVISVVCWVAKDSVGDDCDSKPVKLSSWFTGMFMWQIISTLLFLFIQHILTLLLKKRLHEPPARSGVTAAAAAAAASAAAADGRSPSQEPEQPRHTPGFFDFCFHFDLEYLSVVVMVFAVLIIMWCVLGIITAVDAGRREACEGGKIYIWVLATVIFCQTCACHLFSLLDTHKDERPDPDLDPVAEVV